MKATATPTRASFILAFAAIYLIWGSTYLGIRVAVETMPPFLMAGMRFAIAGVILFSYLRLRGAAWPTRVQWRDHSLVGVFLLLGGNGIVSWAELRTPSGFTSLILGASPLIVVLLDWARPGGKPPTAGLAAGVAVGIAGIALLLGPGAIPAGYRPPTADVIALFLASISWWIGSLYSKHSTSGAPLMMAAAIQMLSGSAAMLLTGWILGEGSQLHPGSVSFQSWSAFAYLVIVGSIVAFPTYVWLLEHSTPAKVSTYAYVNPVVAMFLGWAILGEPMNLRIFLAAAIIIGAVAIITIGRTWYAERT
ncbi:MAG TPA: EamA family transporter [Opitutaceae bacterium]|nr:EamA family transporter [Opitutaceae bacterium]